MIKIKLLCDDSYDKKYLLKRTHTKWETKKHQKLYCSDESELEEAVAAYYAVRVNKVPSLYV